MVEVKMMGSDDLYRTKDEMGYVVFGQPILYSWRE